MPRPAVFLDKDGTLLVDVPYNADPQRMRFAYGAEAAVAQLAALGLPIFVVSNQGGIARGLLDAHDMAVVERELARRLLACGATLGGFYFCPHASGCDCRKPRPGMLLRAAEEHDIDLARSWMIGDILDDVEAGRRAGCRTILIDNGNETEWRLDPMRMPHYCVDDLHAAARIVVVLSAPSPLPTQQEHRNGARQ